jgi:hypothetical protein
MSRSSTVILTFLLTTIVVGSGVYIWQRQSQTTKTTEETVVTDNSTSSTSAIPEDSNGHFEDSWLSFDYPSNVQILVDGQGEGRPTKWLTFMYWDEETKTYSPVGLKLTYPSSVRKDEDFYTFEENYIKTYDEEMKQPGFDTPDVRSVLYYQKLTIGGRDAFLISEGGIGDPVLTLYITFDQNSTEYTSKDVYLMETEGISGYNKEIAKTVMDMFESTAKFSK